MFKYFFKSFFIFSLFFLAFLASTAGATATTLASGYNNGNNTIYGSGGNTGNNNTDGSKNNEYILDYDGDVCDNENIKNAVKLVGKIISIIQIAVPIILIIMALVDITKSIISMDDSKSKKSVNHLIKRLISAVLVFFIIAIVRFICQLIVGDSMESCLGLIVKPW